MEKHHYLKDEIFNPWESFINLHYIYLSTDYCDHLVINCIKYIIADYLKSKSNNKIIRIEDSVL